MATTMKPKKRAMKKAPKKSARVRTGGAVMSAEGTGLPVLLDYDDLIPGHNARTEFDQGKLEELAETIAINGLKSRLIVYPHPTKKGKFAIHGGERRYRAIGLLIKAKRWTGAVPCEAQKEAPESGREVVGLLENLQREDLNVVDKAEGVQHAIETGGFVAWDERNPSRSMGHLLGYKSKSTIYGLLALVSLGKLAKEALVSGELTPRVAEKLARIRDPKAQNEAVQYAIQGKWTDDRAQEIIEERYQRQLKGAPFDVKDAELVPFDKKKNCGGACGTCPMRSGNQSEMFAEFAKAGRGDMCLRPECYAEKAKRAGEVRLKAHEASGGRVLTKTEAEKAGLTRHGCYVSGGYVERDGKLWVAGEQLPIAKVLKPLVEAGTLKPVLARANDGTGKVFELFPRKEVEKAVKELPEVKKKLAAIERQQQAHDEERSASNAEHAALQSAQQGIMLQKLAGLPIDRCAMALARWACSNYDFDTERVLARHGWAIPEGAEDDEEMGAAGRALLEQLQNLEGERVMQILVEGWMMPYHMSADQPSKDDNWRALCTMTGTTPEAIFMGAKDRVEKAGGGK